MIRLAIEERKEGIVGRLLNCRDKRPRIASLFGAAGLYYKSNRPCMTTPPRFAQGQNCVATDGWTSLGGVTERRNRKIKWTTIGKEQRKNVYI
ncbi:hypothetical protein JTE90_021565 [Oedothorax gibbosus]|uniref:Uncharacterized protein n=1 Tax=Oedothorax gibbosus TaxID=931172 RepID=A0AAV6VNV4_9ARAC|nr:hypothetical protein JTE90_021565 [Oedothorax gibbosus]